MAQASEQRVEGPNDSMTEEEREEALFEQAWNERVGAPAEEKPSESKGTAAGDEGGEEGEAGDGGDEGGEGGEGGEGKEETRATPSQEATSTKQEDQPEWYASLPDEAKNYLGQQAEELATMNQKVSALHGRVAPVQQENRRLIDRIENLEAQLRSSSGGDHSGHGTQPKPKPTATPVDLQDSDAFREYKETFPDEAKALEAVFVAQNEQLAQLRGEVTRLTQGVTQIQREGASRSQQNELQRLTEAYPNWSEIRNSDGFEAWLSTQPRSVAKLLESPRAEDNIYLLDTYSMAWHLANQQSEQPGNKSAPSPEAEAAERTRTRRQNLTRTPSPEPQGGGVGPARGGAGLMSEEDLFATEFDKRVRAQQTR